VPKLALSVVMGGRRPGRAVPGMELVVHTSTSEVYGSARTIPITDGHPREPQSPYAASKFAADKVMGGWHRSYDPPVTVVRPFKTYGPRQSVTRWQRSSRPRSGPRSWAGRVQLGTGHDGWSQVRSPLASSSAGSRSWSMPEGLATTIE
jgi:hypothetical protein